MLMNSVLKSLQEQQYGFFSAGPSDASGSHSMGGPFDKSSSMDTAASMPIPSSRKKIVVLQYNAMVYQQSLALLVEVVSSCFQKAGITLESGHCHSGTYLLEKFKLNLEKIFKDYSFVVMIDELDTLANHDQKNFDLVTELLNLPSPSFIKIGISNTLDLFARYKGTKQYVECRQMAFKPYGAEELWGILRERIIASLSGSGLNIEHVCDESAMQKVCIKIDKNACGDIRIMLALVKDIFERKLNKIKKEYGFEQEYSSSRAKHNPSIEGKSPQSELNLLESRVSLIEAIALVDEKCGDVQKEILKNLSLNMHLCLVATYFALDGITNVISYVSYSSTSGSVCS